MRFQDKVVLVLGGNSGIGLASARAFHAEGALVRITGRHRETIGRGGCMGRPWVSCKGWQDSWSTRGSVRSRRS